MADLTEGVGFHRFHQRGEDVLAVAGGFLEGLQRCALTPALSRGERENSAIAELLVIGDVVDLLSLLAFGRADEFNLGDDVATMILRQEGVHADQRQ